MTTRGDRKFGANGCRGASWSKECLVAASRQLRGEGSCFLDVSGLHGYGTLSSPYGILKCTRVLLYVLQYNMSCDPCNRWVNRTSSLPPYLEMLSFQGSCLCELMYCGSVSSGRIELLYTTAVNFHHGVSRERSSCTLGVNSHLLKYSRRACCHSVFLQVCPFELAQQLNYECLYWGGI